MKIEFISKSKSTKKSEYEIESYSEIYQIGNYKLKKRIVTLTNGHRYIYIDIHILARATEIEQYLPELYIDIDSHDNSTIRIQTTSYGALNIDQIQNYISAYNYATEVAKTIENSDLLK